MTEYELHQSLKELALEMKKALHISQNEGEEMKMVNHKKLDDVGTQRKDKYKFSIT